MELHSVSRSLVLGDQGIWTPAVAASAVRVSFPAEGHAECLQIEESSFWFQHRNRCLLETLRRFPPAGPIFELGAGNGFVTVAFEKAGYACVAVEPAAQGARNAKNRGARTVVCSTLESADFLPGSLPAIGLFDVIEHIERDEPFLRGVARALAPGGRLYVTVPAYRWLWSDEDVEAGHFRRYTMGRIARDLSRAGLEIERATYFFTPLVLPILMFRALPRLVRRNGSRASRAASQHTRRSGLLARILAGALRLELGRLRAGRSLPFGTSCLVVAKKAVGSSANG